MLLARLFESLPLVCPNCGADRRILAFITQAAPVHRMLNHIGAPAEPPPTPGMEEVELRLEQRPRISPDRGPPAWDDPPVEAVPDWDALAQPQLVRLRPAGSVVAVSRRLVAQATRHALYPS
jgi:hypothetical protein